MVEDKKYLYHCDCCGELFKLNPRPDHDIVCSSCGEHPVRPKFATVSEMPALDKHDNQGNYGVSSNNEANLRSRNKKKTFNSWIILGLLWIGGLAALTTVAYRINNRAKAAAKADVALDAEDKSYLARKSKALEECSQRFEEFARETNFQSKSAHILNGSDLVLDINRYYSGSMMTKDLTATDIIKFNLIESGDHPKVISVMRTAPQPDSLAEAYDFEVVFWKVDEEWFIDWPHFVRLGDMSWFRFCQNKTIGLPKRFRLYLRELSAESLGLNGYDEYKLSEAYNHSSLPSQLPASVYVKHQTKLKSELTKKFRLLSEHKNDRDKKDSPGLENPSTSIRVDVTVDYEEIEGETVMVLKEVHQFGWENPPTNTSD